MDRIIDKHPSEGFYFEKAAVLVTVFFLFFPPAFLSASSAGEQEVWEFSRIPGVSLPEAPVTMAEDAGGRIYFETKEDQQTRLYVWNGRRVLESAAAEWDLTGLRVRGAGRLEAELKPDSDHPLGVQEAVRDQHGNMWSLEPFGNDGVTELTFLRDGSRNGELKKQDGKPVASGQWNSIVTDEYGFVWAGGDGGLFRFDPRTPDKEFSLDNPVTALALSPSGHVMFGLEDGGLYEIRVDEEGQAGRRDLEISGLPGQSSVRGALCASDGSIWAVSEGSVYRARPPEGAWQQDWKPLSRMPWGNHDIFAVLISDHLYIAGGLAPFHFPTNYPAFDEIFRYRLDKDRWDVVGHLQNRLCYSGIARLNGKVWIVGGFSQIELGERVATDQVKIFDPETGTVTEGPSLDQPRGEPVVLNSHGRIYVIGGMDENETHSSVLSIGADEETWRNEPSAPGVVRQATGCALEDRLYVFSGENRGFIFDLNEREWRELDPPEELGMTPRAALCAAHKGEVWLMGGQDVDVDMQGTTWIFSPDNEKWRRGPDLPDSTYCRSALSWGAASDVNGRLIIIGGALHCRHPHSQGYAVFSDQTFMLRK